jgi:adenosylhomocysteine nucleosidase
MASVRLLVACALPLELGTEPLPGDHPVVWTGVGKVNAAIALTQAIAQHRPQLVVNVGTAGRVGGQAEGLVEVARVIQRDMVAEPLAPRGHTPMDATPATLHSVLGQGLVCATGDSFVTQADPWLQTQGVHLVDMELFAVALACHRHGVGWRAFKYVTDEADASAGLDWASQVRDGQQRFRALLPTL